MFCVLSTIVHLWVWCHQVGGVCWSAQGHFSKIYSGHVLKLKLHFKCKLQNTAYRESNDKFIVLLYNTFSIKYSANSQNSKLSLSSRVQQTQLRVNLTSFWAAQSGHKERFTIFGNKLIQVKPKHRDLPHVNAKENGKLKPVGIDCMWQVATLLEKLKYWMMVNYCLTTNNYFYVSIFIKIKQTRCMLSEL